jgi:lactoylglutathione lyase
MPGTETELVLFTRVESRTADTPEVDLLVTSADQAVARFQQVGAQVVEGPFDIPVGRCAVVEDPFRNRFVILDLSKGFVKTDASRNVVERPT